MFLKKLFFEDLKKRGAFIKIYDCYLQYDYEYNNKFMHSAYKEGSGIASFFILNKDFLPYILSFLIKILFLSDELGIYKVVINNKVIVELDDFNKFNALEDLDTGAVIDEFIKYLKTDFRGESEMFKIDLFCKDDDYAFDLYCLSADFK